MGEVSNDGEQGGDDGVDDCGDAGEDNVVEESREGDDDKDSVEESETDVGGDVEAEKSGSEISDSDDISDNFLLFVSCFWFDILSSPNM